MTRRALHRTMPESRRLLLVDGYGLVYRAYYAIPAMSNAAAEPTNAVFGAIRMLEHLRDHWKATHWAVVFDGGLPDTRMELVTDYKANRAGMPDELSVQLPAIDAFLAAARITRLCIEGQEADDVLAAIALRERECERVDAVLIATSDKDLLQAVGDGISVVPLAGKGPALDAEGVCAKTGVRPDQIVPWLAMIGDSSDNIEGVPGIGTKTAAALLQTYGSLEGVHAHLDELAGKKAGRALAEYWERVERNVKMVQLDLDILCVEDVEALTVNPPDVPQLLALYDRLGFEKFARDLREPELFG